MKLFEVANSDGQYCGPVAISAALGLPIKQVVQACLDAKSQYRHESSRQRRTSERRNVAGMFDEEVCIAIQRLTGCSQQRLTWARFAPSEERSAKKWFSSRSDRIFVKTCIIGIGNAGGHFLTVRGDYGVDTRSKGAIVPVNELRSCRRNLEGFLPIPDDIIEGIHKTAA